jgi:hypothetical protein
MGWIFEKLFKKGKVKSKEKAIRADKKYTSYDTSRKETNTPQKVREGNEPEAEQLRMNLAKDREKDLESRGF